MAGILWPFIPLLSFPGKFLCLVTSGSKSCWRPPAPPWGLAPHLSPAPWQALLQEPSCDSAQGAQSVDLPSPQCTCWGQSPMGAVLLGGEGSCPQCWKLGALKAPRGWGRGEIVRGVEVWAPLRTVHLSEPWGTQTQPCFQFRHVASLDAGEKIPWSNVPGAKHSRTLGRISGQQSMTTGLTLL